MWGLSRGLAGCTSDGYFANEGICELFVYAVTMPQVVVMQFLYQDVKSRDTGPYE